MKATGFRSTPPHFAKFAFELVTKHISNVSEAFDSSVVEVQQSVSVLQKHYNENLIRRRIVKGPIEVRNQYNANVESVARTTNSMKVAILVGSHFQQIKPKCLVPA